jgi:glutathionyl-hydroquinone reductase
MVYQKDDGSYGFSWEKHHDYLLKNHPQDLEAIVHARFNCLAQADNPDVYTQLDEELTSDIADVLATNKNFGCVEIRSATKDFIKRNNLQDLFADLPELSSNIDDELDINPEQQDIDLEDFEDYFSQL